MRDVPADQAAPLLSREQMKRYSRQLVLRELGVGGQRRLAESRVLVVGAGGLGSPAALYLAACGVGTLGIVDGDAVELSNLHRQILHRTKDLGMPKTASAARTLEEINPEITVVPYQTTLTSANAEEIIGGFDLVVNGSDNFPTRYLVSDACVLLRKPLVDASILRWEGQAAVYLPGRGCYRCLFPTPPTPGTVPSCAEAGVIGPIPGLLGALQAIEAVKVLLGQGDPLANRLLLYDALSCEFNTVRWERNPSCPACGDSPTVTALIDYDRFCGLPGRPLRTREGGEEAGGAPAGVPEVDAAAAAEMVQGGAQLVDVRESWEWAGARIPGALLIPKGEVGRRASEIDPDRPAVVYCATGVRSAAVVEMLRREGYGMAFNLAGGMVEWENRRLPTEGDDGGR